MSLALCSHVPQKINLYVCLCTYVCVCHAGVGVGVGILGVQKRVLNPLVLELQVVVSQPN